MNLEQPSSAVTPALAIATVGVLVGLGDLPYGYFMLLRLVLCGISLFLLLGANLALVDWQRWALGGLAVLHNPLLPIRIGEKVIWIGLNIATVAVFWVVGARHPRRKTTTSPVSTATPGANTSDGLEPAGQHATGNGRAADSVDERRTELAREDEQQRVEKANDRLQRWQERVYRK